MDKIDVSPADPGDPDASEIAAALRLSVGRIARKMRQAKGSAGLALSEMSTLARLDREGPRSPSMLAAAEGVRPQAMATTLAALEGRGLVARRPDESDGRRAVLTITEAGRALVADRRSESVRRLAAVIDAELTPAERRSLLPALPLLDRLAERL
ncbi:MarR family winged helix-turn-helix transcriptional regulator [Actinoallomurus rhizosphaericola]|uniref:MarR family winged helix-turn-helix transcriptional regulator n=1 Tax=Actinoallomurus rhizosphaericola TaxID=2952536 RepID=UPI00209318B9|nr:MarR family transcriptional regulator [Actinoallomurus rhizosphaericola]MCO5997045.1 MarR family transcriptional regulator [Actinoallomurus rhizosphaericola]